MKNIFIIARKELREIIRDKRTMMMMVVIPLVLFPVLMSVIVSVSSNYAEEAMSKKVRIGIVSNGQASELIHGLNVGGEKLFDIYEMEDTMSFRDHIHGDSLDVGLYFSEDFDAVVDSGETGEIVMFHDETEDGERERVEAVLENIDSAMVVRRLQVKGLAPSYIDPIMVSEVDVSSTQAKIGKYAGGILPYLFISFCFLGCMYPAIDLFAGEKERGTIETLLTAPVHRQNILIGKMIVIILSGLLSATLAILGLLGSIQFIDIPGELLTEINKIITPQLLGSLYILLIPLVIFFAGVMIPVSIYAKSYKEAQSIIAPLNMVMVLPAIVGFFPGIEYNLTTASIPIVNIVLATKDIMSGTVDYGLVTLSFGVLILFAVAAVLVSFRQFGREGNVLRGD